MADRYRNFADLAAHKREGTHYRIGERDRGSEVLVAAPHGGRTEPHTSKIAKAIAGAHHSLYIFEGLVRGLHITSSHFDEPRAVALATRHRRVLTVHGCEDARSPTVDVFVGGPDTSLRDSIMRELQRAGFAARVDTRTAGQSTRNLCNKGSSGSGVQLEVTRRLRIALTDGRNAVGLAKLRAFVTAVRRGFESQRPNRALHPTAAGAIGRRPRVNAGRYADQDDWLKGLPRRRL